MSGHSATAARPAPAADADLTGTRLSRLLVALYTRAPRLGRSAIRVITPSYRVGVLVVVRRPDGRVLLVDQPYVPGWSLPGGDLKAGETVQACGQRELREELGLSVVLPEPVLAAQRPHDRWVTFVTTVEVDEQVAAALAPRSPELSRIGWFPTTDLPELHRDAVAPLRLAGVPPPDG